MGKKASHLTPRQRKYLKGLTQGKTKKAAALEAGYSESTADNAKAQIEDHVGEPLILEAFKKAGLTEDSIARVCKDAMKASRVVFEGKKVKRVKDHKTRLDAAELAGRFRGDFKERHEIAGPNGKPIETKTEIIIGGFVEKA